MGTTLDLKAVIYLLHLRIEVKNSSVSLDNILYVYQEQDA